MGDHAVSFEPWGCECVCTPIPVWKSEINSKYLPQPLSSLILETDALTKSEVQGFGYISCWQALGSCHYFLPSVGVLGVCSHPHMRAGDLNSSSYTCIASGFTNWAISSQSWKHVFFFIIKNCARDAGVIGSAIRSTSHSPRGPRFGSQHPHLSSQPSVTPATGDLMSFPGLCRYCTHITQTCMQVHICTD